MLDNLASNRNFKHRKNMLNIRSVSNEYYTAEELTTYIYNYDRSEEAFASVQYSLDLSSKLLKFSSYTDIKK